MLAVALATSAGAVLVGAYDRLSLTARITGDSANAVLQGRAMAQGNILLHGWTLSGASFYATDLPFYAGLGVFRGLTPAVAHDAGALIYTLVVLAAVFLARGRATGAPAAARMLVTFALLVAPAPGEAVQLLLLGPFHVGTTLVLLLAFLVLDRMDRSGRGAWMAAAFGLLLALAVMSDGLAVWVGAAPVIAVCCIRLAGRRHPAGPDLLVLASVVAALLVAVLAAWTIRQGGGFATVTLNASFARIDDVPKNLGLTIEGALLLFGANFFGQPLEAPGTLAIFMHLLGFAFVLAVYWRAIRAWRQDREPDRLTQVLLVAMTIDAAAYLFSNQAIDRLTTRYMIPFFVFGSVLGGRLGADWLWRGRLRAATAILAAAYVGFLLASLRTPAAPNDEAAVGAWLAQHHLRYGLAAYWQASTVTVATGGRVRVRAVSLGADQVRPYRWEAESSWYDPGVSGNEARFVVRDTADARSATRRSVETAFGPPEAEYQVGHFDVLVWSRNLLDDVQ